MDYPGWNAIDCIKGIPQSVFAFVTIEGEAGLDYRLFVSIGDWNLLKTPTRGLDFHFRLGSDSRSD